MRATLASGRHRGDIVRVCLPQRRVKPVPIQNNSSVVKRKIFGTHATVFLCATSCCRFACNKTLKHTVRKGGRNLCGSIPCMALIRRENESDTGGFLVETKTTEFRGLSAELVELVQVQLDLLVSILEQQIDTTYNIGVRCAAYCRTPQSLAQGALQMQFVAESRGRQSENMHSVLRDEFYLGTDGGIGDAEEAWVVRQPLIMLPDNGGLVMPLVHQSFLVGLLVVERTLPRDRWESQVPPPINDIFGPGEIAMVKQSGTALSLSCAIDLKSVLENTGNKLQRERIQGLMDQAKKPLSTLRTFGRMLQPRLETGEPERDMADTIVFQSGYLSDILSQMQSMVSPILEDQQNTNDVLIEQSEETESKVAVTDGEAKVKGNRLDGATYYPALPSSTIGADYWDKTNDYASEIVRETADKNSPGVESKISEDIPHGGEVLCQLQRVVSPLISTTSKFCSVRGIQFSMIRDIPDVIIRAPIDTVKRVVRQVIDAAMEGAEAGDVVSVDYAEEDGLIELDVCLITVTRDSLGRTIKSFTHLLGGKEQVADVERVVVSIGGTFVLQHDVIDNSSAGSIGRGTLTASLCLPIYNNSTTK